MGRTTFGRNREELLEAGRKTFERRAEKNVLTIGSPSFHQIGSRAEGQLARLAAFGGDQVNIQVSAILRGECDPLAIRREVRIRFLPRPIGELQGRTAFAADAPKLSTICKDNVRGV